MKSLARPTGSEKGGVDGSFWATPLDHLVRSLDADVTGLSSDRATRRRALQGPNTIEPARGHRGVRLLVAQFESPIIGILAAATVVAMALGDTTDGVIILTIIVISGLLGFVQEHRAGRAVDALLAQVRVHVEVLRDGREVAVPADDIVAGDVVVGMCEHDRVDRSRVDRERVPVLLAEPLEALEHAAVDQDPSAECVDDEAGAGDGPCRSPVGDAHVIHRCESQVSDWSHSAHASQSPSIR
jgi:Mg2+-importing ATPase